MKYSVAKVCSDASEFLLVELKTMRVLFRDLTMERAERLLAFLEDGRELMLPEKVKFDFESIYKEYPRKEGKTAGIRWLQSHVKTQKAYEDLTLAVDRYRRHCAAARTESQFIPHFSTWVKRYPDWVTDEAKAKAKDTQSVLDGIKF